MADVPSQHVGGAAHPVRQRGRVVDADVPFTTCQCLEISIAVADQRLYQVRPSLLLPAAIEESDVVPTAKRIGDLMRADEACSTQDQQRYRFRGSLPQGR